jgi:beta-lactamase regulating signal transducer with metallopeptidase domain
MSIDTMLASLGSSTVALWLGMWMAAALKGSVLMAVAWMLTRALRRGSAALRHAIWTSALAGTLVLPMLTGLVPSIGVGALRGLRLPSWSEAAQPVALSAATPAEEAITRAPEPASVGVAPAPAIRELEAVVSPSSAAEPRMGLETWLPFVLLLGVALLVVRAAAGAFQLSIWKRRAHAVHDATWLTLAQRLSYGMGISRPVTLLRSHRACVPMTWGVVYPRVLLPSEADEWTPERRTIVLIHELAHVKRLDALTQFIAQISVAVFWFNPIVWFAARQMRLEREHACDDFVLDAGARASDYAQDLLQIARSLVTSGAPAAAALAMARRTELEGRLLAILSPRADRRPVSRTRLLASSLGVFALALPLAALRPAEQVPEQIVAIPEVAVPVVAAAPAAPTAVASTPATPAPVALAVPSSPTAPPAQPAPTAPVEQPAPVVAPALAIPAPAAQIAMIPSAPALVAPQTSPPLFRFGRIRPSAPIGSADVETLIAVARAAIKLTSDNDKAELLLTIAKYYVRNDELRTAYLDAVASMTSDYERSRTLEPLFLKDSLPMQAVAQVVKIASKMTSDNDKANLIVRTTRDHPSLTQPIRAALIATAATMASDYDRGRSIAAIAKRGGMSNGEAIDLINVAKAMTSSYEKANALVLIASKYSIDDPDVRKAYLSAAETISSSTDYRRAIVRVLE